MTFKKSKVLLYNQEKMELIFDGTKYGEKRKRWQIKSNTFYGRVEIEKKNTDTIISGPSYEFKKKSDLLKFIARLKQASKFFNKKVF